MNCIERFLPVVGAAILNFSIRFFINFRCQLLFHGHFACCFILICVICYGAHYVVRVANVVFRVVSGSLLAMFYLLTYFHDF